MVEIVKDGYFLVAHQLVFELLIVRLGEAFADGVTHCFQYSLSCVPLGTIAVQSFFSFSVFAVSFLDGRVSCSVDFSHVLSHS